MKELVDELQQEDSMGQQHQEALLDLSEDIIKSLNMFLIKQKTILENNFYIKFDYGYERYVS